MQYLPKQLSIEKCRKLVPKDNKYSDEQIKSIRDVLYKLAGVVVQKYEEIKSFVTQTITLDAKARIIK